MGLLSRFFGSDDDGPDYAEPTYREEDVTAAATFSVHHVVIHYGDGKVHRDSGVFMKTNGEYQLRAVSPDPWFRERHESLYPRGDGRVTFRTGVENAAVEVTRVETHTVVCSGTAYIDEAGGNVSYDIDTSEHERYIGDMRDHYSTIDEVAPR